MRTPDVSYARMWCPACGHEWEEADISVVAQAWYSFGAYVGNLEKSKA